ncbi:hypothetical protein [Qingshengfaniella alkalisoli]|uniref:V/A-type H+-transporting ATPase subunit E n=1 Tax=Qingshengfaniella alkalisoli TaxID=2599296 RepID=A0A5B8ICB1_9RHOB|nr:hypothetical protein [Qingshengfaniella alkalisoli]QDY71196.1 hypothetical protein FPZ52_15975 [Qingshengfaniella alkalisoli]
MADAHTTAPAAGIKELIERLRQEGVEEGEAKAAQLVSEAETRARQILGKAEAEAKSVRDAARAEAERTRQGGEEALRAAMRDTVLKLKDTLSRQFSEQVSGTVSRLARDDEVLKRMILAVAARSREDAGVDDAAVLDVVLPRSTVGLDELRRKPEELKEGSLTHFVAAAAAEMLRDGVTFERAGDDADGIRLVLKDEGLVVDLTDRAVADMILRHLQPRFRALLEGVVS